MPRRLALLPALAALAALAGGCASGSAPGAAEGGRVLRLAHGLPTDHPVHEAMADMARRVDSLSAGALRITIYPSAQLGSERENLELLQIGSLAITKVSAAVLESFAPEFRVYSLPYVFRDEAHRFAVYNGPVGRAMLDDTEAYRLRGLTYYDAGARSFYTVSRPVRTPADLRGLKIRVQESPTAVGLVRALGGAPTPVSWGELYTALQQGLVDGAENNPPSFHVSRHYEVARHYLLNEHTAVPDVLVIGTPTWNALSAQEQAWLQQAADESAVVERRLWRIATEEALRAVEAAGVTVSRPTDAERAAFVEAVQPMLRAAEADPVVGPLLARIAATPGETAPGEAAPVAALPPSP